MMMKRKIEFSKLTCMVTNHSILRKFGEEMKGRKGVSVGNAGIKKKIVGDGILNGTFLGFAYKLG